MKKKPVVSVKRFDLFRSECERWISAFGLLDWEVEYLHQHNEDHIAYTRFNYSARVANIALNKKWVADFPLTDEQIKKTAFHEACELLLYPIRYLSECRYLTDSEVDPEIHSIIHALERVIVK